MRKAHKAMMSDMPEMIWAYEPGAGFSARGWLPYDSGYVDHVKYVRADLLAAKDAEIAALKEQGDE